MQHCTGPPVRALHLRLLTVVRVVWGHGRGMECCEGGDEDVGVRQRLVVVVVAQLAPCSACSPLPCPPASIRRKGGADETGGGRESEGVRSLAGGGCDDLTRASLKHPSTAPFSLYPSHTYPSTPTPHLSTGSIRAHSPSPPSHFHKRDEMRVTRCHFLPLLALRILPPAS